MWKQKREPRCCNSSWLLASGRRNTFEQFDDMRCSWKKWEQPLFSPTSESPFPHFGGTIHMDCGVGAWLGRMWISTSSDGHWRSGNGSAAISYAIHHGVKTLCTRSLLLRKCLPVVGILPVCEHMSGVLFSFDSLMKIVKQTRRGPCAAPSESTTRS